MLNLAEEIRRSIKNDKFIDFKDEFYQKYEI
jgi:queuine/archaeosine tRNA-ribosyltransferase